MAVFHPHTVRCSCGNTLIVSLADSINVKRSPGARERILKGELHRAACPKCKRTMTVEKPFYYTDAQRNSFFKIMPRGERHTWKEASKDLEKASGLIPSGVMLAPERKLRVLFGMDELREKLVAQDAGFDDRFVELFKVLLVYEHPVLLRRPRLRLTLDKVSASDLEFSAMYEHDSRRYRAELPRRLAEDLAANPDKLKTWTKKTQKTDLFALPDHWVNMWRWSPQPTALDRLKAYATDAKAGKTLPVTTAPFKQMLSGLPRGTHLPSWAKQDLRTLFEYAKKKNLQKLEDQLFEIRFGVELEDDWAANSNKNDIDTLWNLLKDLPDTNVEGNTKIKEILLSEGEGGGVYDPSTHDISIGSSELRNRESFEDVVRHEVGHAVHEMNDAKVTGWLETRFGWKMLGETDAEIDQWVQAMGGWGTLTGAQKGDVRQALRTALGNGESWDPGPVPALAPGHPWYGATFGPRLAYEKTGPNWFGNFLTWHQYNGKAFFLNYWYQTFVMVDAATLNLIALMPDPYAAMSPFEFFAEMYALYYDLDDPKRPAIPADVAKWMKENIGAPEAGAAAPAAKRAFEMRRRPGASPKKTGRKK